MDASPLTALQSAALLPAWEEAQGEEEVEGQPTAVSSAATTAAPTAAPTAEQQPLAEQAKDRLLPQVLP